MRYPEGRKRLQRGATVSAAICALVAIGAGVASAGNGSVLAAQRQQSMPAQQQRAPATSQRQSTQSLPPSTSGGTMLPLSTLPEADDGGMREHMDAQRTRTFNDDRHKKLASDIDKLQSLTNELKADLDKTSKDELSLDVIKKANEIEKLAHDVQNRMKN